MKTHDCALHLTVTKMMKSTTPSPKRSALDASLTDVAQVIGSL